MRIEGNLRTGYAAARRSAPSGSGVAFRLDEGHSAPRPAAASPTAPASGIEALLALQAVEDPAQRRKKLVRRANALLDALEQIKIDLLAGWLGEGRLNRLMALIGQARDRGDAQLDALVDDIELRARVELAKRGIYPHP